MNPPPESSTSTAPAGNESAGNESAGNVLAATIPAFAIGHITVRHPQQWADYCSQVPATLVPWGGTVVVRGRRLAVFNGVHPHTDTVVLRFPDAAAALGWHASAAYQALIPLRDAAADVTLVAFEN